MIAVEKSAGVAWLRFTNPPHGFMTIAQLAMLRRNINTLENDPSIRVIVIAGDAPGRFIAHTEIDEIRAMLDATPRLPRPLLALAMFFLRILVAVLRRVPIALPASAAPLNVLLGFSAVERSRKITVAAIDGPCVGGGLELALCCDFRLAADDDTQPIGCPEILIGMTPGYGGTQRLPRIIGARAARELLLAGDLITPREAARLGLISRLVDKSRFADELNAFVKRLARRPPRAVAALKHSLAAAARLSVERGLFVELTGIAQLAHTGDCKDGIARYREILARHLDGGTLDAIARQMD